MCVSVSVCVEVYVCRCGGLDESVSLYRSLIHWGFSVQKMPTKTNGKFILQRILSGCVILSDFNLFSLYWRESCVARYTDKHILTVET